MNVLIDIHHHDLFRSLYYLFNDRLKFNIHVPYGLEWNTKYNISNYPNKKVVCQYLLEVKDWINRCGHLTNIKFLTLDEYKDIKIDIHVSTLLSNVKIFRDLIEKYHPKSKHIIRTGNNFPSELIDELGKNLLSSSFVIYTLSTIRNKIFYHQEFDTNIFCQNLNKEKNTIKSFQHYFGTGCHPFKEDFLHFNSLKEIMPNFKFSCHGWGGDAGGVESVPVEVANIMKSSGFSYHVKPQGDGYGFIYHHSFACGLPVIYKSQYLMYNGIKMTPLLFMNDKDLFVDLSVLSIDDTIEKINNIYNNYDEISSKIHKKFKEEINFDSEFEVIKKFIENLE